MAPERDVKNGREKMNQQVFEVCQTSCVLSGTVGSLPPLYQYCGTILYDTSPSCVFWVTSIGPTGREGPPCRAFALGRGYAVQVAASTSSDREACAHPQTGGLAVGAKAFGVGRTASDNDGVVFVRPCPSRCPSSATPSLYGADARSGTLVLLVLLLLVHFVKPCRQWRIP